LEATILLVFGVVYLGMILGGLPFLSLDRTASRSWARSRCSRRHARTDMRVTLTTLAIAGGWLWLRMRTSN